MRRREFVKYAGAAAAAWPLPGHAQKGMRVIGLLAPNPKVFATLTMERDLAEFGWEAERNLRLIVRTSTGSNETLPALAADLVAQNVDVVFTAGDRATVAAQRASTSIPIVAVCDDMVGSHLVESMARPGGNTTGISIFASELDVKRLQLLHELLPEAARIGILADATPISTRPPLEAAAWARANHRSGGQSRGDWCGTRSSRGCGSRRGQRARFPDSRRCARPHYRRGKTGPPAGDLSVAGIGRTGWLRRVWTAYCGGDPGRHPDRRQNPPGRTPQRYSGGAADPI